MNETERVLEGRSDDRRASGVIFGNAVNEQIYFAEEKQRLNCDTLSRNRLHLKQQQEQPNNVLSLRVIGCNSK